MISRSRSALLRVRDSFWFWPAALGLLALVLGQVLVSVDRAVLRADVSIPFLDALSASGGRSILTTIGTSMLTVAGTSFSIVISVLATTTSTYGPRLVRNFMADRANQLVLAAFTSTFVYTIVVLRSVHTAVEDSDAFVPVIAVHVAVLLGILDAAVLVFFIHHVATSVEVTTLQRRVRDELRDALDTAYVPADDPRTRSESAAGSSWADADRGTVRADVDGYVAYVAWDALGDVAADSGAVVRVIAMPGDHVIAGEPLAEVGFGTGAEPGSTHAVDADLARRVRAQFAVEHARTPYQDVRFALQQLVESAVRGLASGTNDPYTAVSALDLATGALAPVLRDRAPIAVHTGDDDRPLVLCAWPSPGELVGAVLEPVVDYGADHRIVIDAARRLLDRLGEVTAAEHRPALDAWRARLPDVSSATR